MPQANEFFDIIKKCFDYFSEKIYVKGIGQLSNEPKMRAFACKADEYCQICIDYNKILHGRTNLSVLSYSSLPNYTRQELSNNACYYAELSVIEYMNACKLADQLELTEEQLLYRHNMGLAFYVSNKLLEAQLIVISEIFLIKKLEKERRKVSIKAKEDLKKLIEKIEFKLLSQNKSLDNLSSESSEENKGQLALTWTGALQVMENNESQLTDEVEELLEEKLKNSVMLLFEKDRYETKIPLTGIDSNLKEINKSIITTSAIGGVTGLTGLGFAAFQGLEVYSIYTGAAAGSLLGPVGMIVGQ